MKLADETLETLRKDATAKIKLACGIAPEEKVLKCTSAKKSDKYLVLEYTRTDGKSFTKGDASRLSISGNYANSRNSTIEFKIKL